MQGSLVPIRKGILCCVDLIIPVFQYHSLPQLVDSYAHTVARIPCTVLTNNRSQCSCVPQRGRHVPTRHTIPHPTYAGFRYCLDARARFSRAWMQPARPPCLGCVILVFVSTEAAREQLDIIALGQKCVQEQGTPYPTADIIA